MFFSFDLYSCIYKAMVTQKLTAPSDTITGDIALLIVMKCCDGWLYVVGLFTRKTNVNYLDLSTRTLPLASAFLIS